ncbi:hypothetical protein D3C76_1257520 [compost metagenome]
MPSISALAAEKVAPSGVRVADLLSRISIPTPFAVLSLLPEVTASRVLSVESIWPVNATEALAATAGSQSFSSMLNGIFDVVSPTLVNLAVRYCPRLTI